VKPKIAAREDKAGMQALPEFRLILAWGYASGRLEEA
jgi:hypothetical protein